MAQTVTNNQNTSTTTQNPQQPQTQPQQNNQQPTKIIQHQHMHKHVHEGESFGWLKTAALVGGGILIGLFIADKEEPQPPQTHGWFGNR